MWASNWIYQACTQIYATSVKKVKCVSSNKHVITLFHGSHFQCFSLVQLIEMKIVYIKLSFVNKYFILKLSQMNAI